jgi:cystathionine gamma-synthase
MLQAVGDLLPPNTAHAVSVSLPTWKATVGYEEGEEWVLSKMKGGYPRFFVHPGIKRLSEEIIRRHGDIGADAAMLFPSPKTAGVCCSFLLSRIPSEESGKVRVIEFVTTGFSGTEGDCHLASRISCVIYPKEYASIAKQVWQHTGDGISSRRSDFFLDALEDGCLVEATQGGLLDTTAQNFCKGPKRYQRKDPPNEPTRKTAIPVAKDVDLPSIGGDVLEWRESVQFIEERFGRNLNSSQADNAKLAIRRRISGSLTANVDTSETLENMTSEYRIPDLTENDVFLFPTGMSSIFHAHQNLMFALGHMKSICFGFPYIDTLKVLEKWGPGCLFYGHGSSKDLDDLERRLSQGEKYLALFTEFPGNPLLKSVDLRRIHALAQTYGFTVVIDETIGNFINVNVLPYADVVVSSLTKTFSGDSNVMGGSAVINPQGRFYCDLKKAFSVQYEDNLWAEDAIFLERNSRDFVSRIRRINETTEALTAALRVSPLVKKVYYPQYSCTRPFYDVCRTPNGGYGGLFSIVFHTTTKAIAFFDSLEVMKGPSLGTNFTLSCPYVLLAHYGELDWATSFGIPCDLIRISVGLEDPGDLCARVQRAIDAVQKAEA